MRGGSVCAEGSILVDSQNSKKMMMFGSPGEQNVQLLSGLVGVPSFRTVLQFQPNQGFVQDVLYLL